MNAVYRPVFRPMFRAASAVALAIAVSLSLLAPSWAQEPPGEVRLTLQRYEELMDAAQRKDGPRPTWGRGTVDVALPEGSGPGLFAEVSVTAELRVVGEGLAEVPLVAGDVVLQSVRLGGNEATLLRRQGAHVLVLDDKTRTPTVSLSYLVPAQVADDGSLLVVVPLPPMPGSSMTLDTGGRPDLPVDVWPAASVERSGGELTASLPGTVAAVVRFGVGAGAQNVRRADYKLELDDSGDGVDVTVTHEVHVTGSQAHVRVASAQVALMEVTAGRDAVATRVSDGWHVATVQGRGRQVLVSRFRVAIDRSQGQPQVALALAGVPITSVETVIRGKRQVTLEPAVPVTTTFTGGEEDAVTVARAWLPPSEQVIVRWTESRAAPEDALSVNTETYQLLTLQEAVLRTKVQIRYDVIRGKTKELAVAVPDGLVPYKVRGEGIEDWHTFPEADGAPRQIRVTLGRELVGSYLLELELEAQVPREEGAALALPLLRPLGAYRESGVVALFDGDKVGFGPAEANDFSKVGEDALPSELRQTLTERVSQAFKHIGAPGPIASKVATAKPKDIRFDARVQTLYQVKDGALVGLSSILVEMKSGRQDALILSLPDTANVLNVTAPSLNKHEPAKDFDAGPGRKGHEVRFTQALEGAIQIDLEVEVLLPKELGKVALPDVRVHGADVEKGSFGLSAETGIEAQPQAASDIRRVDVTELPNAIRLRSEREILFGYTYAYAPWALQVELKRHQTVETLKAVVNAAWLETTVLEDGHVVTRALFRVANEDRQFLRLKMPPEAKVWRVSAGGQAVKAVKDQEGALAVPLPKAQTVLVDVVYDVPTEGPGAFGSMELVAPQPDMLVTDLQWLVRTPPKLAVLSVDTALEEQRPYEYRRPDDAGDLGDLALTLPSTGDFPERLFTKRVYDPAQQAAALEVELTFAATPGRAMGVVLWVIAVGLLAAVVWRRARKLPLGAPGWVMLAVGLGLALVKAAAFQIDEVEGGVAVLVLLVVAVAGWRSRPREAGPQQPPEPEPQPTPPGAYP